MNAAPGLYVHVPFCLSRCIYCTFSSRIYHPDLADAYIDALCCEVAAKSLQPDRFAPSSLFIGGGTPSCLSLAQLKKLLSCLPMTKPSGEATIELNPDSCDADLLDLLLERGFTRCSFGVQTFDKDGLVFMRRRHTAKKAAEAVSMAKKKGFSSVNIDLITAWPGQTLTILRDDIARAAELGITHLSCYTMMIEPDGKFQRMLEALGKKEKDDIEARVFWDVTNEMLAHFGFYRYEVSNFALPGFECRHNLAIWKGGEYHGLGPSSHSHIDGRRFSNFENVEEYVRAIRENRTTEQFSEQLNGMAKARECAVFWLRLTEGVLLADFQEKTGYDFFELYKVELPALLAAGMLALVDGRNGEKYIRVPEHSVPLLDSVLVELV